jgi:hypothetical protein
MGVILSNIEECYRLLKIGLVKTAIHNDRKMALEVQSGVWWKTLVGRKKYCENNQDKYESYDIV